MFKHDTNTYARSVDSRTKGESSSARLSGIDTKQQTLADSAYPGQNAAKLAPFVMFSISIHIAVLFFIHLQTKKFSIIQPRSMIVYFVASPVFEHPRNPHEFQTETGHNPPKLLTSPKAQDDPYIAHSNVSPTLETPTVLAIQQLQESARKMAQDEAIKTEQFEAAQKKKKLTTPIALLEQSLKKPYKEIRLANGMIKIITSAGEVCFQPVPYFAHDSAGLFGIPMTCP